MNISLTVELEAIVKAKVKTGLYNNASEVVREALRFMDQNQELIYQLRLDHLRAEVSKGANQAEKGNFSDRSVKDIVADLNTKYSKS